MKPSLLITVVPFALAASVSIAGAQDATARKTPPAGAGVVAPSPPAGAVLSGAQVTVTPVGGGSGRTAPIAANGLFALTGLAPGRYRVALTSISGKKQTQGATFGEKVKSSVASSAGNSAANAAGRGDPNGGMPSRISMNMTIARQIHVLELDGAPMEIEVGADGRLTGLVAPR